MGLSVIRQQLTSEDEETRRSALKSLKSFSIIDSRDILFLAMSDESWRVRKEAVEVFVSATPDEESIVLLLNHLRNEDNAGLRNSAAEAVIRLGALARLPLISMTNDADEEVRKFVIDVMGAIGIHDFVKPLLEALNDVDVNVSSAAAEHLGSIGDITIVQDLIKAIAKNDNVLFRFSALAALSKLAEPAPVPTEIIQLANQDILKKSVYDCLGTIADDSATEILLQGMWHRQKSVRSSAVKALYKVFGRADCVGRNKIAALLQKMKGSNELKALFELFDSRDVQLAEALIWCVSSSQDFEGIDLLIKAFRDERLSERTLKALKTLGADAGPIIVSRYLNADEFTRCAVCTIVGALESGGAADIVFKGLNDVSALVRKSAVEAAGKLRLAGSIQLLVQLVDDGDQGVRAAALSCLQTMALIDRATIQTIANNFCASEHPEHRRIAALLLSTLGDGDRLTLLMKDEVPLVRQSAVSAIGKLKLPESVGLLSMALVDEDPDVRISAAESLGELKDISVLSALRHALDDSDIWVQCAALKALKCIDVNEGFCAVKKVFNNAQGLLMITCLEILSEIDSSDSINLMRHALSNTDPDIARQAASSLERCFAINAPKGCS